MRTGDQDRESELRPPRAPPSRRIHQGVHDEEHRPTDRGDQERRALWAVPIANAALLVIEAAGGFAFGSLVLMADAGHLLADVSALAVSVAAIGLGRRRPTVRHTFGFERAEVLAAQLNALLLVAVMAWIVQEAIRRLAAPPPVQAGGMLTVALLALAVNGASSIVLARAAGRSLNMRGKYVHLVVDAAGSLTAIVAAALILGWGLRSADPVASLITAALAVWAVFGLIRGTTHVLMEGAPRGLDARQVEEALLGHRHVAGVHHLHLWSLASDVPALSAHVMLAGKPSLTDAQRCAAALRVTLAERFGIVNVTLEFECEPERGGPMYYGSSMPPASDETQAPEGR
jgi:cobalt-zinc-cadmium efflux system protein